MTDTIIPCVELNTSDIKFYPPRPTGGGGKNVGMMNKRTNTGIRLELPMMFTYGASDYEGNKNYSFGLQFPSDLSDPSVDPIFKATLDKLIEFETFLKTKVFQNAKEWTQKAMKDPSMVDMIWNPMLKYPLTADKSDKDYTRSPTLNVKLPCWEGKWTPEVYDSDGNCQFSESQNIGESPIPFFTKGTNVIAVIQCGGLYIVSGKIGITWKLIQAVVKQADTSLVGKCLIRLPESKKKEFTSSVPPPEIEEADQEYINDSGYDSGHNNSNESSSETENEEEIFTPVVSGVKTRGRGKKY